MRIAAAQTAPVWGDPGATAEVVVEWIHRSAEQDVDLIAFGETFLSGYPFWVGRTDGARWNADDQKEAYAHYLEGAVDLDGPELAAVAEAAASAGVFIYLGVTERSRSRGSSLKSAHNKASRLPDQTSINSGSPLSSRCSAG